MEDVFRDHINDKVIGFYISESDNKGIHRYDVLWPYGVLGYSIYSCFIKIYEYNRVEYVDPKKCLEEKKPGSAIVFLDGRTVKISIYFKENNLCEFRYDSYVLFYVDSECYRIRVDASTELANTNGFISGFFPDKGKYVTFGRKKLEVRRVIGKSLLIFSITEGCKEKYELYHESDGIKSIVIPYRTIAFLRSVLRRKAGCSNSERGLFEHPISKYPILQPTFFEESIRFISRYKIAFENLINSEKYS